MINIFYPPLKKMSGGMAVLLQLGLRLRELDRKVRYLVWEKPADPSVFAEVNWQLLPRADLGLSDVLVVPEGWPNALTAGLGKAGKCIVYCQNWAYFFDGLPENVRWQNLNVFFAAVSDPVAFYIQSVTGKQPPVIRPAIDFNIFYPPAFKPSLDQGIRIAWMPRKNKREAELIRRIFNERNPGLLKVTKWIPIQGFQQGQVADTLRSCHFFLATGFPEGCPLPPLEAMACGCLCVGYAGFGGWDYMRQIFGSGYSPHNYCLRDVSWGGNGFWFADRDVLGAAIGLEAGLKLLRSGFDAGELQKTVCSYNRKAQLEAVARIFG